MNGTTTFAPLNGQLALNPPFPGPSKTRPSLLPKLAIKPWIRKPTYHGFVFTKARVVDPAAGKLLNGLQTVVVKDGKVMSVSPMDESSEVAEGLHKVDLNGRYICPGLVDCHVHVTAVPGVQTMGELVRTSVEEVHYRTTYILKEMLLRGFTTVRDTGGATKALARSIAEGLLVGPRLIQCGKAISQTGGHGDFAPGIKIMVGGGVASETDGIETVQYTEDEIRAITTTCRQMGNKHTTAHAYTVEAIRHAVDNGVMGIEHGNLIDRETASYMAERGVFLTPTLSCYGIMVRPPFQDFLPPDGQVKNAEVMQEGLEALKIAEEAGVTVCYGSDLLTSMHALQTEEFAVRAEILPSPVILRHATTNAAKMLRMEGKIGAVAPGAFADLLILDANPLDDVTVLDRPEDHLLAVMKEGKVAASSLPGLKQEKDDWTPSLMYGTAAPAGEKLWQSACAVLPPDAPHKTVSIFLQQTYPAFPVLDKSSIERALSGSSLPSEEVSYGLLTSLIAHSTCYVTELRPHHKHLWRQVLLSLEDEYRKPSLQTLQLALITVASRPAINTGQNTIAMARLVGAAQLLGLHLDPTLWRISHSQRVLRKRIWWLILINDKWRALLYGRPSNAILSEFYTVRALTTSRTGGARLQILEGIAFDLATFEKQLSPVLQGTPASDKASGATAATGVRSFQLCKLGIDIALYRLISASLDASTPAQFAASLRTAVSLVQTVVEFLENLTAVDHGMFWMPYCSFHLSNAAALLLRTALAAKSVDPTTRAACGVLFTRLVVCLTSSHHATHWDVASLALDRIATLLRSLDGELAELVPLLQLFGPPHHANVGPPSQPDQPLSDPLASTPGLSSPPATASSSVHRPPASGLPSNPFLPRAATNSSVEQLTSPMSDLDPLWWMNTDILSLPSHLNDLPPSFDSVANDGWWNVGAGARGTGEFDLLGFLEGAGTAGGWESESR
ncbi:hypothetical protein JCM5296_005673 [Sporobolomyces johnsonii]